MKLVTIIIPTINNLDYLIPCVQSIAANTIGLFRFVIVNQGSKEIEKHIIFESQEVCGLRASKMLHVDEPLGWMRAINYGFKNMPEAIESPRYGMSSSISKSLSKVEKEGWDRMTSDYILMMNDDTMILPGNFGWLTDLTNVLECDPSVGAVGPASNFVSGWQSIHHIGGALLMETKYLIGFCLMVRRDLFEQLGELDETLPGGDDLDLSIRIRDVGYKLVARRNTFVYHFGQITGKKTFGSDWDSERHQAATKHALIKKHGFKKTHEMYLNNWTAYDGAAPEYGSENIFRKIVKGKGLDIGCGQNKEPEAVGIDSEIDGKKTQADIIGGGDCLIAFSDNSQDYIIGRHIIEHFYNPLKTLREWSRVLKQGGKLGISTPDGRRYSSIDIDGDHKHQYDRETMVNLINLCGFKVLECDGCKNQLDFYVIAEKL